MKIKSVVLLLIILSIVFISYSLNLEQKEYNQSELSDHQTKVDEPMAVDLNDDKITNKSQIDLADINNDISIDSKNNSIDSFNLSINYSSTIFNNPLKSTNNRFDIKFLEDGTRYIINPKDIVGGGPPKDGIPSIDNPKYVTVKEADEWIQDNELILALEYKGVKRVYPLQIMVWHEIVNDVIAGDPILITYCPLCGSGIAYERIIDGEEVEFGTSGKLYNSNLVMYDRKTDSYWQQIDGVAIVGEHVGKELNDISIDTLVWRDYKSVHPDAAVLSQDTGHSRAYGRDPYGNYYENTFLFFDVEEQNDIIHPKTPIIGIEIDGVYKAYEEDMIRELKIIEDEVAGKKINITSDEVGFIKVFDDQGEEIVKERDFWFAWYAFHPDTLLFENKS